MEYFPTKPVELFREAKEKVAPFSEIIEQSPDDIVKLLRCGEYKIGLVATCHTVAGTMIVMESDTDRMFVAMDKYCDAEKVVLHETMNAVINNDCQCCCNGIPIFYMTNSRKSITYVKLPERVYEFPKVCMVMKIGRVIGGFIEIIVYEFLQNVRMKRIV